MNTATMSLHFAPLLPGGISLALGLSVIFLTILSGFIFRRGLATRALVSLAFLLILFNPSLLQEQRERMTDTLVVVTDRSSSQGIGNRTETTDDTFNVVSTRLAGFQNLFIKTVDVTGTRNTSIFSEIDRALSDTPVQRRAGVIIMTDGQVHDVPGDVEKQKSYGPVHFLLTGERHEFDRRIIITEAPSYGIVGQTVSIRYKVEDSGTDSNADTDYATVLIRSEGEKPLIRMIPLDTDQIETMSIKHPGQNIFEIEVAPLDGELTPVNNRIPVLVNGVRDRLKVLLVSGQPHPGERTWRDLLTSDPGVDLVHFTILREPTKVDITPQNELSLIAFPFRELFEIKLYDFDLIIFDRYGLNRVLPNYYFNNIAEYVRKGGALLEASGPSFAGNDSVYTTALKDILPAYPTGLVEEISYTPSITDLGQSHPVTQNLNWGNSDKTGGWGPWMRLVGVVPKSGDVVMAGAGEKPLLILDHVGQGRVAQLASDQIWLWSRGFMGGGPQTELLRRLAHWLMKEPELEENALDIISDGDAMIIRRRNYNAPETDITLATPDGSQETITLKPGKNNWLESRVPAKQSGIYSVQEGNQKKYAIAGEVNPLEWRAVHTTDEHIKAIAQNSSGSVQWLQGSGIPDIRRIGASARNFGSYGWIGLRENNAYSVTSVRDIPFIPAWFSAFILLVLAVGAWWFEGRSGAERRRIER